MNLSQVCSIIDLAVADLRGSLEIGIPLRDEEVAEICVRLEYASIVIRLGSSDKT